MSTGGCGPSWSCPQNCWSGLRTELEPKWGTAFPPFFLLTSLISCSPLPPQRQSRNFICSQQFVSSLGPGLVPALLNTFPPCSALLYWYTSIFPPVLCSLSLPCRFDHLHTSIFLHPFCAGISRICLHLHMFNASTSSSGTKHLGVVVDYTILVSVCLYLRQANTLLTIFLLYGCNRPLPQLPLPLCS